MRLLKVVVILFSVLAVCMLAAAADKNLGIQDKYHVTFDAPIRVGTALLPAGDYVIRHTMEGQDHIMVFQKGKESPVKVKCTLVPLPQKALVTKTIYVQSAANERVLQELVFRGDTAKHVF
ncbi:MAG: hypothetical protein WAM04_16190 [Candidatus Sulfotelmatobacter sp.]